MTETRETISSAIRAFLSLIQPGEHAAHRELADLAQSLDRLVAVYFMTNDVSPDTEDSDAPRIDQLPYAEDAAAAFPGLGWHAVVDPEGDSEQQIGYGIASSDLAEIAADLLEVMWLFENASENDAIWQYRWGYQNHWGRHAQELRLYLHAMGAW